MSAMKPTKGKATTTTPRAKGKPPIAKGTPAKAGGMFAAMRKQILRIPKGRVSTYGAIAYVSGYPGASRQVVWALRSSAGLPWHRVIGAGGVIKLPGEQGFEQRMRLRQEGIELSGLRIDMKRYEHNFFAVRRKNSASVTKASTKKGLKRPPRK
jgi:methylated-DNA-protein-cysteine methyltransferase-like protein